MNYRLFLRPDAPQWEVAEWNFKSRRWQLVDTCYKSDTAVAVLIGFRAIRPCKDEG